jgi:hypothetical protein
MKFPCGSSILFVCLAVLLQHYALAFHVNPVGVRNQGARCKMQESMGPKDFDNYATQSNPTDDVYGSSREGHDDDDDDADADDNQFSQEELDNHANQGNPSNYVYWSSRGDDADDDDDDGDYYYSQDELENHADQCKPNNDAYWSSRG